MKTFRTEKNKDNPGIKINMDVVRDERLSWKARGIYGYVCGLESKYFNAYELKGISPGGIDSIKSGIDELFKYGYLESGEGKGGYVYLITDSHGNYKIGETSDLITRMDSYERLLPYFKTIATARHCDYKKIEKELHKLFKDKRVKGEWFKLDDSEIECFISKAKEMECENIIIYETKEASLPRGLAGVEKGDSCGSVGGVGEAEVVEKGMEVVAVVANYATSGKENAHQGVLVLGYSILVNPSKSVIPINVLFFVGVPSFFILCQCHMSGGVPYSSHPFSPLPFCTRSPLLNPLSISSS